LEALFAFLRNSKNAHRVRSAMDVAPTSTVFSETPSASRIKSAQVNAAKRARNASSTGCALMDFSAPVTPTPVSLRTKLRQNKN
jgi:hypothetical protein